ncbi:filamentous hemagglutinin N-terminal domain-containing protein [Lusitaniella coriacea LEGE 07157]|uniref:Filamentous hemagglutinin N-terminal domain-containing protein n=1 Tax=Lusitaniella coriacea LEGE 07157 TaxID=945747 RepID=A0A8J7DXI6_9CYAN|nr:filamentous hemagglutinin N-terminal domain-containing protein [Lusitaniella coriacea]MBE9117111.1 filamentous hemagglutinin N-terminal domain-containing protein [Lusitaniella coriacea LEGE 07157]
MLLSSVFCIPNARAQIIPDNTLGAENSVLTPIDALNQRIDGGAARGINLFHSFLEFNIGNGSSIYFANPTGIENILTRVTGNNASNILGTLGVLGNANLFLINPNGIYFGENARLDVSGSFLATTADGIQLGTQGYFSATDPQNSQLLSVQPSALFSNSLRNWTAGIRNEENLAVGGNLTLIADELDLKGQLSAEGNLTLAGANLINSPWNLQTNSQQTPSSQGTLQIRDSATNPFIAAAGGELLVQGNETVDIFALNHPDSGLYSGGNMVLRSGNQVGGDAHYYAGGSFRIEQLDGNLGDLFSPFDPVIRSSGDVSFGSYTGTSLHIFAGGSVTITGNVRITGADPTNFINETVTLSDGTTVNIDGSARPTLDIRAGTTAHGATIPACTGCPPTPTGLTVNPAPTGSNITVNAVDFGLASNGIIFLTNQFSPDPNLPPGNIHITNNPNPLLLFNAGIFPGSGGDIIFDSRGEIIADRAIAVEDTSGVGDAGDVTLLARDNISFASTNRGFSISSAGQVGGNIRLESDRDIFVRGVIISQSSSQNNTPRTGGDITIRARNLSLTDRASIINATLGTSQAGAINIAVSQSLTADGESSPTFPNGIYNQATQNATGNTGNIRIAANTVSLINGTKIDSTALGQGNTGKIEVVATESFMADGESSLGLGSGIYNITVNGNGENIDIRTPSLNLTNGAVINSTARGQGNSSNIQIVATDNFTADGESRLGITSGASSNIENGNGGSLSVQASSLNLSNGASLRTATNGAGNAGAIDVAVSQTFNADGESNLGSPSEISSFAVPGATGNTGEIRLRTSSLNLTNGATLRTATNGVGNAGAIDVAVSQTFNADGESSFGSSSGISSFAVPGATGSTGAIRLRTSSLNLTNGATLRTITSDAGNAGAIDVAVAQTLNAAGESSLGLPSGISSLALPGATGNTEGIRVGANALNLMNGANISSNSFGQGTSSNIEIAVAEGLTADGATRQGQVSGVYSVTFNDSAGDIDIQANFVKLTNGANLISSTSDSCVCNTFDLVDSSLPLTEASSGTISIRATQTFEADGESPLGIPSGISTNLGSGVEGSGGDINIETSALKLTNGATLSASTAGRGDAGQISIAATDSVVIDGRTRNGVFNSGIASAVTPGAIGNGGNVSIRTGSLALTNKAILNTVNGGRGNGGSIDIQAADSALVEGGSQITTSSFPGAIGDSGNIELSAQTVTLSNKGFITAFSGGQGNAGDVDIRARSLTLLNQSGIETLSFLGSGGNINLGIDGQLVMRYASLISATAGFFGSGGDGGNIDIAASFIVGIREENSDITANAFSGRGGNIRIATNGIFGLKFRPRLTPLSDITASSEIGIDGTFDLDLLSFPSEQGLNQLPSSLVDAESAFARDVCGIQDGKIAGGSSLTITGRGGMPPSPLEPLTPLNGGVEWSSRDGTVERPAAILRERTQEEADESGQPKEIRLAQGWVVQPDGTVLLTAEVPTTGYRSGLNYPDCGAWGNEEI